MWVGPHLLRQQTGTVRIARAVAAGVVVGAVVTGLVTLVRDPFASRALN
jgi:hypothetical protein